MRLQGLKILEAENDECLEDLGSARLRLRCLESLEAGSDKCLKDPGSGRLNESYVMYLSWSSASSGSA